jgi:CubicO group peptidase (beta-lactamase class C family)
LFFVILISAAAWTVQADNDWKLSPESAESIGHLNVEIPYHVGEGLDLFTGTLPAETPDSIAPWPTVDWTVSTPEEQGMDRRILTDAFRYAAGQGSMAVLVIRNGYIVGEWYGPGWTEETRQSGFSIAKSFSSAIVGMLIDDGVFTGLDQPVSQFITEWQDGEHDGVTIRNLLSMNSGLYWDPITDYIILPTRPDQNAFAVGLPMESAPGSLWVYNNSACQVISELILRATGMQAANYASHRLAAKIGMWNAGWLTDNAGNTLTYQSVIASAREFAKFGYLFLRGGEWDGEQIVSSGWVAESTTLSQMLNPFYGYLWWCNTAGLMWTAVPADAYAAMGFQERRIYVVPSLDIVAVRLGDASLSWSDNRFLGTVCGSVIE